MTDTFDRLRGEVRGQVIVPGDAGYDDARRVWNGMIDRHPAVIVRCTGVADVVAAIRAARTEDIPVAVRGGGHSFAGFGTCDDGMVIDLGPMKGIRVDLTTGTAWAQPGLTWGEYDRETIAHGLATTGGLVSGTGIAGFTLGGGIGWLMRRYGMAVDNLLAADIVTADGTILHTGATEHPDLLWALRGGGGNFGVVTAFQHRLHRIGATVVGGAVFHPLAAAPSLLRFYGEWVTTVPDELTTMVSILTAPPLPFMPPEAVGTQVIAVAACGVGDLDQAMVALAPLKAFGRPLADVIGPMPYLHLQTMFDAAAPPGARNYFKTAYADRLSDDLIDTLLASADGLAGLFPLTTIHLQHLGGAIDRIDPDTTAFAHRGHPFVLNLISTWLDPADDPEQLAWPREALKLLSAHIADAQYVNFLADTTPDRVRAAYGTRNHDRLVPLKRAYDPTNLFRFNLNIPPTG